MNVIFDRYIVESNNHIITRVARVMPPKNVHRRNMSDITARLGVVVMGYELCVINASISIQIHLGRAFLSL